VSVVDPIAGAVERVVRFPVNALEYTNILLTTDDAVVGATPRDVVWTHRKRRCTATGPRSAVTECRCCSCSR
jgi:hypothetical protein